VFGICVAVDGAPRAGAAAKVLKAEPVTGPEEGPGRSASS